MSLEADLIVDRRKLRGMVSRWRLIAFVSLGVVVLALGWVLAGKPGTGGAQDHIARISLAGLVTYDRPFIRMLDRVAQNDRIKGVLLQIDSPGGSTAGSEAVYSAIRRVSEKKPVVAVVGTLGASGAYVAALASDRIVAAQTSLVGSIGVLIQWAEFDQAIRTLGVRFQEIKTSPLKASPNGFEPASDEAKAALRALIDDSYKWFTGLVKERRTMSDEALALVADGRVFTGRQALELRLVDQLGDDKTARAWLAAERKLGLGLPERDYKPRRDTFSSLIGVTFANFASSLGLPEWIAQAFQDVPARLDGMVSVWHPNSLSTR